MAHCRENLADQESNDPDKMIGKTDRWRFTDYDEDEIEEPASTVLVLISKLLQ